MARDTIRGVWLTIPKVDELSRAASEASELRAQLARYGELTRVRSEQVAELSRANAERKEQAAQLEAAVRAAEKSRADAEVEAAAARAWYRSPWLWAGVGAVLGGGVVILVAR